MTSIDNLLPPAKEFMKKLAVAEAEEAAKQAKKDAEAAAEKQALLDHRVVGDRPVERPIERRGEVEGAVRVHVIGVDELDQPYAGHPAGAAGD